MPWQAHLYVGERVATFDDVRRVFAKLGHIDPITDEDIDYKETPALKKTITLDGQTFNVTVEFEQESEGGSSFPSDPANGDYTDALIGIALTRRYSAAILDRAYEHGGRPEPFRLDLVEIHSILDQVHVWWPDAELFMFEVFH